MNIKNRIDELFDELVAIRRNFHMFPELSNEEFQTNKKIRAFLDKENIYNNTIAKTGVLGLIKGSANNKTIALRADIDALEIQEANEFSYKSKYDGIMHACGHDVHTTILLGTAKILQEMKDDLPGNVKLLFQPAEETTGGALIMIEEGALENPYVDYVLGLHVMPYLKTGQIELKHDKLNAASDMLTIIINGKSGHGAYPESSTDAIVIASHVILALQTLVSRNISPLNSAVLSIGTINGGTKGNIISNEVVLTGILRTLDEDTRAFALNKIKEIVKYQANAFGGDGTLKIESGYESLINNNDLVDLINETAIDIIGKENIIFKDKPSLGVEDFSYFSNRTKGAFYHLGCKKGDNSLSLHNNNFDLDEECIKLGIELQVKSVLKLLNS